MPWRVRAIFDKSIDTGAPLMGAKLIDSELPTQPRAWPGPLCITTTLAGIMPRRRAGRVNRLVKEALPTHITYAGLINALGSSSVTATYLKGHPAISPRAGPQGARAEDTYPRQMQSNAYFAENQSSSVGPLLEASVASMPDAHALTTHDQKSLASYHRSLGRNCPLGSRNSMSVPPASSSSSVSNSG